LKSEQKEKISQKFVGLVQEGHDLLRKSGWDGKNYRNNFPSDIDYKRYRAESLNIVRRVCGEKSDYYLELRKLAESESSANNSYYLKDCCNYS